MKNGLHFEKLGHGSIDYRRNSSGELVAIVYHNPSREKLEKKASKLFPHYVVSGCESLGWSAYYRVK